MLSRGIACAARANVRLATTTAPSVAQQAPPTVQPSQLRVEPINKIKVGASDNLGPISTIAFTLKAGPRYETTFNRGVSHVAQRVFLSASNSDMNVTDTFRLCQQHGIQVECEANKEFITYLVRFRRQYTSELVDLIHKQIFTPVITYPVKQYLADYVGRDIKRKNVDAQFLAVDGLHHAAYRGETLGHSSVVPTYQFPFVLDETVFSNFWKDVCHSDRLFVLGTNCNPSDIFEAVRGADAYFQEDYMKKPTGEFSNSSASKYIGGEFRKELNTDMVHTAFAFPQTVVDPGDVAGFAALLVLERIIGFNSRVDYGGGHGKVGSAVQNAGLKDPFAVRSLNCLYSDSGLLGFQLACHANDASKALPAAVKACRSVLSGTFEQAEFEAAKNQVKFDASEIAESDIKRAVSDAYFFAVSDGQLPPNNALLVAAINKVSLADVKQLAQKLGQQPGASSPSLAVAGDLNTTPYLSDMMK